jgi:hypothetical protein
MWRARYDDFPEPDALVGLVGGHVKVVDEGLCDGAGRAAQAVLSRLIIGRDTPVSSAARVMVHPCRSLT